MAVGHESVNNHARGKVLLLAQEIEFAKVLAGNDKRLRARGMKKLRKWLMARSSGKFAFTDDDFLRIWKGIFYCMWMADKLLVQEELAETISHLIHCFKKTSLAISFIRCFFRTMVLEWYGIDQFRYDKFMMLVRRFLRQTFKFCRNCQWQEEVVTGVCNAFSVTVLTSSKDGFKRPPLSLVLHFCDIYLQELAKVGKEKIPVEVVTAFLQPFITVLSVEENGIVRNKVVANIFHYLMKQSDAALNFTEKWKAWKSAGCPGESWEDMERVDDDEEEKEAEEMDCEDVDPSERDMLENEPLDPRAGSVDVELPQIPFDSRGVAEAIQLEITKCTSKKYSKALEYLAKKFIELAEGKYPLAKTEEKNVLMKPKVEKFKLKNHINKAVFRLNSFEEKLGKKKRKRKNKKKTNKEVKVEKVKISKDNDVDKTVESVPSVSASPEKISKQNRLSLDETNIGMDTPLKHISCKSKNSSSPKLDWDISDVEPSVSSVIVSPENIYKQSRLSLDDETNVGTDAPLKHISCKSRNSSSPKLDGDVSDVEPFVSSVVESPEKITEQSRLSLDDETNIGTDTPLKHISCKSKNSSSPKLDGDISDVEPSVSSVVVSPEKISEQSRLSLDDETNIGTYTPLKHSSRKRRNSGSPKIDWDTSDIEPKLKVKKKEIVNQAETDITSLCSSTPLIKKKLLSNNWEVSDAKDEARSDWEVSDTIDEASKNETILLPSGATEVKMVVQTAKEDSSISADSSKQIVTTPANTNTSKKAAEPVSNKKVNIALNKNGTQDLKQYRQAVRQSPAIPFDGSKQPSQGVLKPSPVGSRINPFYRLRGRKMLGS